MTDACQGYYSRIILGGDFLKESRLFRIVYYLLEKGRVTAPELAEKFEVSVRTIYRDVDVISSAGIPIYVTTGRNGGIRILDDYVLEKSFFSDQEKQELLAALQSLCVISAPGKEEMLTKLSALFHIHSENWFEADFSRWGNLTQDHATFELLKNAVIRHKTVRITYYSSYGEQSKRRIHPLKLLYKSKEWYVKAYCTEKQDFRIFKLHRIAEASLLDEEFTPVDFPEEQNIQPKVYNKITLRFSKDAAYRVYDEFEADQIEHQENGDLIVSPKIPEDAWLIGFLLSFGAQVEIMEPFYLRKILSDEAKKIYEKNKARI